MVKKILFMLALVAAIALLTRCSDSREESRNLVRTGKHKLAMGKNQEALDLFSEAIRKDEENFEAWYYRGSCEVTMGRHVDAIRDFDRSIGLKPGYAPAWYNRGQAWFYLGDQVKSCNDWKKAEELGYPNIGDKTRHCR